MVLVSFVNACSGNIAQEEIKEVVVMFLSALDLDVLSFEMQVWSRRLRWPTIGMRIENVQLCLRSLCTLRQCVIGWRFGEMVDVDLI
jgi:hypothetical protein